MAFKPPTRAEQGGDNEITDDEDEQTFSMDVRSWFGFEQLGTIALVVIGAILVSTMPVMAQEGSGLAEQWGNALGNNGGGAFAFLVWLIGFLLMFLASLSRLYSGAYHIGETDEDVRRQGRKELALGGLTMGIAIVVIPAASIIVSTILPESWSWLGVDISGLVNLPGSGDGGGEQAQQAAEAGMMYLPIDEIAATATDTVMLVIPALV